VFTADHVRHNEGDAAVEEDQEGDAEERDSKEVCDCLDTGRRQRWEKTSHGRVVVDGAVVRMGRYHNKLESLSGEVEDVAPIACFKGASRLSTVMFDGPQVRFV